YPLGQVGPLHQRAGAVRLQPAVVEVAGGDAVDQELRRRGQAVAEGVQELGDGAAGQAEVEGVGQRRPAGVQAGQVGRVDAFTDRRAADDDEVARPAAAGVEAFAV